MRFVRAGLLITLLVATGCPAAKESGVAAGWAPKETTANGLRLISRTEGERFLLSTAKGAVDFVPGINLGATEPGHAPGEVGRLSAETYRRWLKGIGDFGFRAVRIYTIHPPAFYDELVAYNRAHPSAPLYLVQGVYLPDESYITGLDLFADNIRSTFSKELTDASAAAHGRLERAPARGRASGTWKSDASPWLAAYIIGVEWDPVATEASDRKNAARPSFKGKYFSSNLGASPTERWLAEMLDRVAVSEAGYGRSMPLAFVNWPTADPLRHPQEPNAKEDLVSVDANHISVSTDWPGGYFASYHAYPYYPDFLRHEAALASYRYAGQADPYAGYLAALQAHHRDMPVMITEFGVPSSLGSAHNGPLGRSQGNHSEQEQMRIDAELLCMIRDMKFAAAFLFSWTDEWFKFTWNTTDLHIPADRRPLWSDPWTNEQHFGLVATDAGTRPAVTIDGDASEWTTNGSQVIYEGRGGIREVRAIKDEAYLSLGIRFDQARAWEQRTLRLGFDVLPGGNRGLPDASGIAPESDYAITIPREPGRPAQAYVRASNDQYSIVYGSVFKYVPFRAADIAPESGVWSPQRLIINRPLVIPGTGKRTPAETFEIGLLPRGSSNPSSPSFDSRSLWEARDDFLEIRLPYMTLGFSDPSSKHALIVGRDGRLGTALVERVGIALALDRDVTMTSGYAWEQWQSVTYRERPKVGSEAIRKELRR